ncbi:myotubularin-related protein 14 isoform X10 [Pongo pygmaeus]|uniref:myotubularin-related protein 14 isoform X10 n=1 Tax=Pongo pygmaeus TaxID=9600 RepID=UPI0023E2FF3D|nr:myotubularin-related protein 14 isoform X14 [Pongo pygmaeus]XP_054330171.1 myotubularin-related protein 14 isoform X14 [Pongo pygmaeus]XP_054407788.1 myotubularin-related protein 14 isoform X5 [Pongo abelii]
MAGARAAAAAASAGSSASSGNQQPQEPGLGELLEEFSRTQYRAKDGSGTGGSKVERIEKRCLELFGRDYCFSVIPNTNGDICGHYPRHIVFLEYESSEKEKDTSGDTHLFDKVRGYDIKLLRYLSVKYICDLMVENKKVKFGMNVTSSEKVDKAQRYADFTLLSIPYPGCEFFKEYKDRDYMAEGLIFNWKQDYVDAPLSIPDFLTHSLNIDWSQYQCWDLVQQTQNYLKLLLSLVNSDDDSGLLVHCISGWDRTPLFISLLRLSLWADGLIHTSLKPAEILYLTVAYDWFLFGHMLVDRLSKGEEIFFFCFNFLKHITSEEFSALKTQRRKSLPARDGGFTLEDICMLRRKDRGSTTSLGSDFSLVMESSPGATGSFTYEAVELVPAGAPTQAAWRKSHSSSPQSVLWNRPQPSEDRLPSHQGLAEARSSSSSSSNHSDNFFRMGSSPLEVPKPRLAALSDRETRLQEVRSAFLAAYSSTVGLRAVAPSPSGAIGGLLEQFARGVGLRGISSNAL